MTIFGNWPRASGIAAKKSDILDAVRRGHDTIAAIGRATGYPATTVIRVAALMVDEQVITAKRIDDILYFAPGDRTICG